MQNEGQHLKSVAPYKSEACTWNTAYLGTATTVASIRKVFALIDYAMTRISACFTGLYFGKSRICNPCSRWLAAFYFGVARTYTARQSYQNHLYCPRHSCQACADSFRLFSVIFSASVLLLCPQSLDNLTPSRSCCCVSICIRLA